MVTLPLVKTLTSGHAVRYPTTRHGDDSTRGICRLAFFHSGDGHSRDQAIEIDGCLTGQLGVIDLRM